MLHLVQTDLSEDMLSSSQQQGCKFDARILGGIQEVRLEELHNSQIVFKKNKIK